MEVFHELVPAWRMLHSSTSAFGHDQTDEHCLSNHMLSDFLVLGSHKLSLTSWSHRSRHCCCLQLLGTTRIETPLHVLMCCARASSRCFSSCACQACVRQDSWSSTNCWARFRPCWSRKPDSLPTASLQQSPCLPACSSCHTGSCAENLASSGVWSTGPLHPSAARQPVPPRSAGPASLCTHGTHCGQVRVRGCNLTGKGCTVCAAALNLGSFVLDDVFRRSKIRAQGFMLLDGGTIHGLSRCDNTLSDRIDRTSSSLFPESSAARLCDFSSDFMALATHMSLSLASHSTTACNSVTHGIPVTDQLVSRFLRSGTLPLLVLHALSMLQDSLGHTRHRLLLRRRL